jgi:hypothetical protein
VVVALRPCNLTRRRRNFAIKGERFFAYHGGEWPFHQGEREVLLTARSLGGSFIGRCSQSTSPGTMHNAVMAAAIASTGKSDQVSPWRWPPPAPSEISAPATR